MEIKELKELVMKQQDQIQTLVDELVETEVVKDEALDARLTEKIKGIKKQFSEMRKEAGMNNPFSFGPMGEA
jgi:nitrogen-specific signal transduction histidine kinase